MLYNKNLFKILKKSKKNIFILKLKIYIYNLKIILGFKIKHY